MDVSVTVAGNKNGVVVSITVVVLELVVVALIVVVKMIVTVVGVVVKAVICLVVKVVAVALSMGVFVVVLISVIPPLAYTNSAANEGVVPTFVDAPVGELASIPVCALSVADDTATALSVIRDSTR